MAMVADVADATLIRNPSRQRSDREQVLNTVMTLRGASSWWEWLANGLANRRAGVSVAGPRKLRARSRHGVLVHSPVSSRTVSAVRTSTRSPVFTRLFYRRGRL